MGKLVLPVLPARARHPQDKLEGGTQGASQVEVTWQSLYDSPVTRRTAMFTQLYSWENLLLAYRRAAKGKRGHWAVAAFEHRLEDNLLALQTELSTYTYAPGGYSNFYVHDPKCRLISAAPFRDRVVHHALCNLVEPLFERTFVADSYANRVGKGTHRARDRVQQLARRHPYVLQCDLRQFFPSMDHAILRQQLAQKVADPNVLWLIDLILASGQGIRGDMGPVTYFPGDDLFAASRPRGLPIGNLTSQLWANVYLNPFDHFVKRELRCPGYVRYVDDFALFGDDRPTLWSWLRDIRGRLSRLRLKLHPGAHPRPVTEGVPFLGFTIFPNRRRLKRRKGVHFRRKLRGLIAAHGAGEVPIESITASVQGWVNHVRYANTVGLRKAVLRECTIAPRRGDKRDEL